MPNISILSNISLKPYNTFGIDVIAKHFVSVGSIEELQEVLNLTEYPQKFILGGGSNILLTKNIDSLVIHINLKGKEILKDEKKSVIVKASAGENWHEFVMWCLDHNFGGIENLSLIPGNIGTAPIQNIGAYGVELKDVFVACEAIELKTKKIVSFSKEDCQFGYRNSIFKNKAKGKYVIVNVSLRLSKIKHELKMTYGAISSELDQLGIKQPTIKDISNAVIAIRQSKLPDPSEIGNSGSFFKNPVITIEQYKALKSNFPEIPNYPISEHETKVPAGWLIEKAGFKGKRFNNHGVHKKQALVLVNYGNANGNDIFELSRLIQLTVKQLFNINLQAEVNII